MAKLYFYYSAMNAGKTTTLLQSAHNYHERGMRTLILTPKLDNRFGEGLVASRIGLQARGTVFTRDDDLLDYLVCEMQAVSPPQVLDRKHDLLKLLLPTFRRDFALVGGACVCFVAAISVPGGDTDQRCCCLRWKATAWAIPCWTTTGRTAG